MFKTIFCKIVKIATPIALFAIAAFDLPWLAGVFCVLVLAAIAFDSIK